MTLPEPKKTVARRWLWLWAIARLSFFPVEWVIVGLGAAGVFAWIEATGLKLHYSPAGFSFVLIVLYMSVFVRLLGWCDWRILRYVLPVLPRVALAIEYGCLCFAAAKILVAVSYLVCLWNRDFVDAQLVAADRAMGFDWLRWFAWSQGGFNPRALRWCYDSMGPQLVCFVFWFAARANAKRLREVFWVLFTGLAITVVVSGLFPALGPALALGVEQACEAIQPKLGRAVADVLLVRSTHDADLRSLGMVGIVFFPSFHTLCALALCYGFRGVRLLWPLVLLLNAGMLAAIPFFGDHYLSDVVAGAVIAAASILAVRLISRLCAPIRHFSQI